MGEKAVGVLKDSLKTHWFTHKQELLMARVARPVKDRRLLKLIRAYLESGVCEGGLVTARKEGTPQGGPLSPLLSNILLTDLDWELEKRLSQVSHRRAPVDEVMRLVDRYRSQHEGWSVKHYYAWYQRASGGRSYNWVRNCLQDAGAVAT